MSMSVCPSVCQSSLGPRWHREVKAGGWSRGVGKVGLWRWRPSGRSGDRCFARLSGGKQQRLPPTHQVFQQRGAWSWWPRGCIFWGSVPTSFFWQSWGRHLLPWLCGWCAPPAAAKSLWRRGPGRGHWSRWGEDVSWSVCGVGEQMWGFLLGR